MRHLFTLSLMRQPANVVLAGGVGLWKTHLAAALRRYTRPKLMIVDELGYVPFSRGELL